MNNLKVLAHCSYIGNTGINSHARNFFRTLSKYQNLKIRNFTIGSSWKGESFTPHDGEDYINDVDKKILYQQTLTGSDKVRFNQQIYNKKIEYFDLNLIANLADHYYYYENYIGPKIAYFAWETTRIPDGFFNKLKEFDEVWVTSKWQKSCMIDQGFDQKKLQVIPEGIETDVFLPEDVTFDEYYSDGRFKFVVFGRWEYRKSTKEIIEAFLKTFDKSEPVDLILSVDNGWPEDSCKTTEERLKHYGFEDSRLKIVHFPQRKDYVKFLKKGHVFVSCSRGEGWNLPLIEAMACGTPSIYSKCSAQMEYAEGKGHPVKISKQSKCPTNTGNYYEPDFEHLSEVMRDTYLNYKKYKEQALKDSIEIREKFNLEIPAKLANERITEVYKNYYSKKMKILFIAPHLSTGGCPQYLLKKIKVLNEEHDVYCIEYANYGIYAVQRNQVKETLKEKFFELPENKDELNNIIDRIKPDVVHLEEMPEYFMDEKAKKRLYRSDRPYILIETSHDSSFDPETKTVMPDKLMLVSEYQKKHLKSLNIPSEVHEYPIVINSRKPREEAIKLLGLNPELKHVVNVGLFTPRKNQAEIVEYAKKLTHLPIQFHFIGNQAPNFKNYWEPIMKDFPSNCIWWNERKDVYKFYQAADLFLFTSRGTHSDKETSPLVIREAISYNIPSLIYNLPVYLGMYDKYDNIKYLDFDSKENNIDKILDTLKLPRIKSESNVSNVPQIISETIYSFDESNKFDVEYEKSENKIFFSSNSSYSNLLVSVKELDSEAVVWSANYEQYHQHSRHWIIPVPKSYIDFEASPAFGGLLVEFYQDEKLLFQKKIRIKSVISKPKLKIKNNTEPVYVNYTEFFVDKIYDEHLSGKNLNVVVDVGANLGVWTEYIQHISACKKIYAVEPNIKALKTLKQSYPNNDIVTIVEKAMANKDGEMEFFVDNSNSGISSLSNLGNLTNSYKVKTTTFKTFIKDNNIKYIDLLKIDIETGEYDLISSMDSEDFSKVGNLLIEYHLFDGRTIDKDVKPLSNKLEKLGYKLEMKHMHDGGGYIFADKPVTFNKEDRLESLLKEYRMDYVKDDCNGVNRLHGLYDLIKEKVKENFHIAEVGSYIGRSTELFALNCEKIYSIDPYASYSEIIDEHMNSAESKFLEMAKNYDNITKIKKTSLQAANDFEDKSLDLVYIDGAHDYQNVKNDILAWLPKVKVGGFICGHDYDYHEIKKAINEIYPEEIPSVYSDFSWAIQIKRKPKEIFIVSAYPDVMGKEELLNDTITKLKSIGKTVMIASHYAIPSYIVEKVDYYIYDAFNMMNVDHTLDRDGPDYWMETDGFRMETILSSHVSALTRIFGIAFDFAKNLGYDYFVAMESDSNYDVEDLKKFDVIKNNIINQNKKLFFCKPKRTEFNWFDERVYETYAFGGFIDEFNKKLKLPTNYSDWKKLYDADNKINCFEYLIYKNFKDCENDYLILGTLKSYFVNSKIDLFTVGDPIGVYYNSKDENQPLVFLTNGSNKTITYNLAISDGNPIRTMTLNPGQWWMYALDISKHNVDVCIWSEENGKTNKKYRQTITSEVVKKLKNYKIIKFK